VRTIAASNGTDLIKLAGGPTAGGLKIIAEGANIAKLVRAPF
jgi:hypothetical protein